MTIPTHKEMIPVMLSIAKSYDTFKVRDVLPELATVFNLTEEEQTQEYETKNAAIFIDRANWSKSYLKMAGYLQPVSRAVFKITPEGMKALELNNEEIISRVFDAVRMRADKKDALPQEKVETPQSDMTPDEMMRAGYSQIKENLKNELLEKIKEMSPIFFEELVVKLLKNMGYGDPIKGEWEVTKSSNDEGIDGIIKEDALGLEVIYIQAKRWSGGVGRPEIQKFAGALLGKSAKKGVFITTSDYSSGAIEYAKNLDAKIILINGSDLAEYMVDYNVGVSHVNTFEIKALDTDFFEE